MIYNSVFARSNGTGGQGLRRTGGGGHMEKEKALLLFSPGKLVESESLRRSFLRIPEVTVPLQHAQKFLDKFSPLNCDLINYMAGDDEDFMANSALQTLCAGLVQWGLYQRLTKRAQCSFQWILGDTQPDSPIHLVLEQRTLVEYLWQSPALKTKEHEDAELPVSVVPQRGTFQLFEKVEEGDESEAPFKKHGECSQDCWNLMKTAITDHRVKRIITMGPSSEVPDALLKERQILEFDLLESVELDPYLSWFWTESRNQLTL